MGYKFYSNYLNSFLSNWSFEKATLYSLYNCERVVDLYILFDKEFDTNYASNIKDACNYIWDNLYDSKLDEKNEYFLSKLINIVPDSDIYGGIYSNLAVNVLVCLDVSYKCWKQKENSAYQAAMYVYDSITQIVLFRSKDIKFITSEVSEKIDQSDLIQNEIKHQKDILTLINESDFKPNTISSVREIAKKNKIIFENINFFISS